jgi:hypothetical protein
MVLTGRMGKPSELQGTIVGFSGPKKSQPKVLIPSQVWMASDASSYLTGSDIVSLPNI